MLSRFAIAMGVTLIASSCTSSVGPAQPDPDGPDVVDTSTRPVDAPPGFDARNVVLYGEFGYDAVAGRLVTVVQGDLAVPPGLHFWFHTDAWEWDPNDTEEYCTVWIPFAGAVEQVLSVDPRLWYAFETTGEVVKDDVLTNCNVEGYELASELWGPDPVGDLLRDTTFFLAIGDLSPTVKALATPKELAVWLGGAMGVPSSFETDEPGRYDDVLALAFEMDEANQVTVGTNGLLTSLPADSVNAGGSLRTGYYRMFSTSVWSVGPEVTDPTKRPAPLRAPSPPWPMLRAPG
ncbi:MAG: hypothetical protein KTR31_30450 [Myxococcales bacterium]|nr:hypothetical protein [Myxococcales bacterium]